MRTIFLLAALLPFPALAEPPSLASACAKAASIFFDADQASFTDAHEFPDLEPPRVQLRLEYSSEVQGSAIATLLQQETGAASEPQTREVLMRCEFENTPGGPKLTAMECADMSCHVSADRIEELRVILAMEGR